MLWLSILAFAGIFGGGLVVLLSWAGVTDFGRNCLGLPWFTAPFGLTMLGAVLLVCAPKVWTAGLGLVLGANTTFFFVVSIVDRWLKKRREKKAW